VLGVSESVEDPLDRAKIPETCLVMQSSRSSAAAEDAFFCSCRPPPQGNNFLILGRGFDVGSPPVHHLSALLQVFRPVVGCADLVPLGIGELALYYILPEAGFVEDRACECPETLHRGALVVAKAVEGVKKGIFEDGLSLVSLGWEE